MQRISVVLVALFLPLLAASVVGAAERNAQTTLSPRAASAPGGNDVAARVNGVAISNEEVKKMAAAVKGENGDSAPKTVQELRKEALDRIILSELAYQKARREGVKAEKEKIDEALAKVKRNLGGDEEFKKFLENQKITEEQVRSEIERSLIVKSFISGQLKGIKVPEDEVKREYEQNKKKYSTPEKVETVDVIFFLKPGDPDSLGKAEGVLKKIKESEDKDPTTLVSDGTFVARKLEIDREKDKELYTEARKLSVGEISGVVRADGSLHILKLTSYKPEVQFSYEQVKGLIERRLRTEAVQKKLKVWETELRKDAKIEIVGPGETPEKEALPK